jgi:peptidoglycan hydrolase CwlO-like protein
MKCGILKGGAIGLGLAAAGLFWVFGGRALDLVQSKAEKARQSARAALTSFDDEIDLARKQVAKLDPAIGAGAEALAKLEDSVTQAKAEMTKLQTQLAERGRRIETLSAALKAPSVKRVATSDGRDEFAVRTKNEIGREIDSYKQVEKTLTYTQDTLKYREALVQSSYDRLMEMKAKKKALLSKIDEIEARHKARVASQQFNEFRVDTSALAEAEKSVGNLDRVENIATRTDELQSELSESAAPSVSPVDPNRDLLREADEILKKTSSPVVAIPRPERDA